MFLLSRTYLCPSGADVNLGCGHAVSPLCVAAATDKLSIARMLLRHGADVSHLADSRPLYTVITPLHYAIVMRNVNMAKLVLDSGHNPNYPSNMHHYPVLEVIKHNCPGIMTLLVENPRCNLNSTMDSAFPPLHQALFGYHRYQIAQILLDCGRCQLAFQSDSYLCVLLWRAHDTTIMPCKLAHMLLEAGADVSCRDRLGTPPLIKSFSLGNPNINLSRCMNLLRIVISAGITPSQADAKGIAVHAKNTEESNFCDWIETVSRNPLSLKDQIRKFVRQTFGVYPAKSIEKLPLPPALHEFVSLRVLRSM